jgi:hypothetical protein
VARLATPNETASLRNGMCEDEMVRFSKHKLLTSKFGFDIIAIMDS